MTKNRLLVCVSAIIATLGGVGCSNSIDKVEAFEKQQEVEQLVKETKQDNAQEDLKLVPKWVLLPPVNDSLGVYAVGVGQSEVMDSALKKSSLKAQFGLAKAMKQTLVGSEQLYAVDSKGVSKENYKLLIESVVDNVPIHGFEVVEHELVLTNGKYTSYTLLRLSYEQYQRSLESVSGDKEAEEMRKAFSELYQRLENRNADSV